MENVKALATPESNLALARFGAVVIALAFLQIQMSGPDRTLLDYPVTLGLCLYSLLVLTISLLAPRGLRHRVLQLSAIEACLIAGGISFDGAYPLLAVSLLTILLSDWSMTRREQLITTGYHLVALGAAWLLTRWQLSYVEQLATATTLLITASHVLLTGTGIAVRHPKRVTGTQPKEVLIQVTAPDANLEPALLYNPENPSAPLLDEGDLAIDSASEMKVQVLTTQPDNSKDLIEILRSWGREPQLTDDVANFIATANGLPDSAPPPSTMIIDTRGDEDETSDLISVIRRSERLRSHRCLLITNAPDNPGAQDDGLFDVVLHPPLDKTLLFNALHIAEPLPGQTGVASLLERYLRDRKTLPPMEILLAMGSQLQRKVLRHQLEKEGHHVYMTPSGEQALEAMTSHHFDAAIIDHALADMEGPEVVRMYRLTHSRQVSVPIVMVANDLNLDIQLQCEHAGADDVIAHPVSMRQLNPVLARLLKHTEKPTAEEILATNDVDLADNTESQIDHHALRELEELGNGLPFVRDLIENFIADSEELLATARHAINHLNLDVFHDCAHALKGSAGSVGAVGLQRQCLRLTAINAADLNHNAEMLQNHLSSLLESAQEALLNYLDERGEQMSRN